MLYSRQKKISPHWMVIRNVALVFVCLFLISRVIGLVRAYARAQERLTNVTTTYAEVDGHHNKLDRQYKNLTTREGVEYYLRDQYRAVAQGEELVVLVDDNRSPIVPADQPAKETRIQKILQWLDGTRK